MKSGRGDRLGHTLKRCRSTQQTGLGEEKMATGRGRGSKNFFYPLDASLNRFLESFKQTAERGRGDAVPEHRIPFGHHRHGA